MPPEPPPRAESEGLGGPLVVSASCHGALLVASVAWGILNPTLNLGSPDASGGGGAVSVSTVPINVVRSDEPNPVANPTRHSVPAPSGFRRSTEVQEPEPPAEPEPPVPAPSRPRKAAEAQQERSVGQRSAGEPEANELRSSQGAALSSELYRASRGGPAVGFGGAKGGPFGSRYGWYAEILQRAIAQQWRRALSQVAGGSRKPVVTTFVIHRTGRIDQVVIGESSGNRSLDYSAIRAINNASPVRPLPPGLGRQSIVIEMHFRLD